MPTKKKNTVPDAAGVLKLLQEKIGEGPEEILAHYELALILHMHRRYREMAKILKNLLAKQPDLSVGHFLLALAEAGQKKIAAVKKAQARALDLVQASLGNGAGADRGRKNGQKWNEELQAFKERYPDDPNLAEVKYYEKVVESGEYSYEQTFLLGLAYKRLGWHSAAIVAFQQVIKTKPNYDEAHFELGNTYKHMGKFAEAEKAYREAIRLNPEAAEAHYQLGLVLVKLNKIDSARDLCKNLERLDHYLAEQLADEIQHSPR